MKGGVRLYLTGTAMLLALAGCGRGLWQYGERASWRHQAEVECLKSGAVKIGTGVVQIQPIEGPGLCGADFPLKVAMLGESSAIGYADEMRPPGAIPNASTAQTPRWPPSEPPYARPAPVQPVQTQAATGQQMRWVPGPPGVEQPRYAPQLDERAPAAPAGKPMSIYAPGVVPEHDDIPDDAVLPPGRGTVRGAPAYRAPAYEPPQQRSLPRLGPMRGPQATAALTPAVVTPPATLACPIVSALDRWVSTGVQPAALRWFGAPVAEIKQISAYSCRSMVGAGTSNISEHAFGNALDIAGFVLADGRKVTVKDGWRGSPEEQGFLHDVQLSACETFSTVLAPGYNIYHYDHIHVDLMRRESGRRPCRPEAIPGDVVAAKARAVYASKHRGPAYTSSIATQEAKRIMGIPGEDGDFDDDDSAVAAPATSRAAAPQLSAPATTEITGSIASPHAGARPLSAGDFAIRMQELRDAAH